MKILFDDLKRVLRKRADDPAVFGLTKCEPHNINRSAHVGYVDIKDAGISVMFKEAPWIIPQSEITDPKALHVEAVHFYREGYDGHSEYSGQFPNGIMFNDSENEVLRKAGQPSASGGGGFSKLLNKSISHWLKYSIGNEFLHFQFDADDKLDMVTIHTLDLQKKQS